MIKIESADTKIDVDSFEVTDMLGSAVKKLGSYIDPIPGESGHGYLSRIAYLNGYGSALNFQESALSYLRPSGTSVRRRFEYAALCHLARTTVNWGPAIVAENFSNYSLYGTFTHWNPALYSIYCGDYLSGGFNAGVPGFVDQSSESYMPAHWWEPLGMDRKTHYYCEECANEQREEYGFSTWMLMHNIGRVKACGKHQIWLTNIRAGLVLLPGMEKPSHLDESPQGVVPFEEIQYSKLIGFLLANPLPKGSKKIVHVITNRYKRMLDAIGIKVKRMDVLVLFASFISKELARNLMMRKKIDVSKDLKEIGGVIEGTGQFYKEYSEMIRLMDGTKDEDTVWNRWLANFDTRLNLGLGF